MAVTPAATSHGRTGNPNRNALEATLASLEQGTQRRCLARVRWPP
jgi:cystathionine beta-lyase/cystathionine gamma-synthase